MNWWIDEFLG